MDLPVIYIPIDRRQALAARTSLPDRTTGAGLFADISGFTSLTVALVQALGPQRGAEEMTLQLNRVFEALTAQVHEYRGSIIGFSGDAITCWFDGDDGLRATTCALALQSAMTSYTSIHLPGIETASLALKAVVTAGPARRFMVGDPQVQILDIIAGGTMDRLSLGEGLTGKGEVIIDQAVRAALGSLAHLGACRVDEASGDEFFVVEGLTKAAQPAPWSAVSNGVLTEDQVRPWLLPPVYQRLTLGEGDFLAELRPVVSVFMRFQGIDYDGDATAGEKLDRLVRRTQEIVTQSGGYLLHISIGDKGSYLSAAFGALVAHNDDAARAASAAVALRGLPAEFDFLNPTQIGISRGRAWTGPYGGSMRRTYGVIGNDVNLAARLMMAATPGQILVSRRLANATAGFAFETLPDLVVKGRAEAVEVAALVGARSELARRVEPQYRLPMIGREAELAFIGARLDQALDRQGQVIAVIGEAGMGKSRLLAEVVRRAAGQGFEVLRGDSSAQGANTPYLVWQPIWRAMFGLDTNQTVEAQLQQVEAELRRLDPALVSRMPLLDTALSLPIPDNELTRSFDAKLRKVALEALLADYLKLRLRAHAEVSSSPLLLVLEDAQWLDPLSDDLLAEMGRAIVNLPVLIALAYRPPQPGREKPPAVMSQRHATEVVLVDFTSEEAGRLIDLKLDQFAIDGIAPAVLQDLKSLLIERAQGNPFYIDEFINYLRDAGLILRDTHVLTRLDLPDNLESLILSRIDQLVEHEKVTLKVASVVGRLFQAAWLWDAYPELGGPERVRAVLNHLRALDLTVQDRPEPELSYLFKHVLTQEVAYESLTYANRARLHGAFARFIETLYADSLDQYLDLLAFHYSQSQNEAKQRQYLRRAGEAAQTAYANTAATDYYRRLLPLLGDAERSDIMLKLGQVLELVGQWQEAEELYRQALTLTTRLGDAAGLAHSQCALGTLMRRRGQYEEAILWLGKARETFETLGDQGGLGQALHESGTLAAQRGDYTTAEILYNDSLGMRRAAGDVQGQANSLNNLGIIARSRGDHTRARRLYAESLALNRSIGNRWAIANSLNNLANVVLDGGDKVTARALHEEGLAIRREIGDRWAIANSLNNLGNVVRDQGDYATAHTFYHESISIYQEFGDKRALAYLLEDVGCLFASQGEAMRALRLAGAAATLRQAINAPLTPNEQRRLEEALAPARQSLGEAATTQAHNEGQALSLDQAIQYALCQLVHS